MKSNVARPASQMNHEPQSRFLLYSYLRLTPYHSLPFRCACLEFSIHHAVFGSIYLGGFVFTSECPPTSPVQVARHVPSSISDSTYHAHVPLHIVSSKFPRRYTAHAVLVFHPLASRFHLTIRSGVGFYISMLPNHTGAVHSHKRSV